MDVSAVILAVASPPGRSARGIVRISGAETFRLLEPHLRIASTNSKAAPHDRTEEAADCVQSSGLILAQRGFHRAVLQLESFQLPLLALVFPGPDTYTGEDSVELQPTGNPALLQSMIDALLDSAHRRKIEARRAEAGEFTARAFLNGRISLTQAEGIAATIGALSDAELRAAKLLSSGRLGGFARRLADELAAALALVEAGIDFTDQDDVVAITAVDLHARLVLLSEEISSQLSHAVGMEQLEAIPWVVLTGAPNAGKSTLFNALLGHERAIVSTTAGTTRDVLAEPLMVSTDHGPAEVMLVDVAGAIEDESILNLRMQEMAGRAIERAELVIRCLAPDDPIDTAGAGDLHVRTKADLITFEQRIEDFLYLSAATGQGMDALRDTIADRLANRAVSLAADATVLGPRHEAALRSAERNLAEALSLVRSSQNRRALHGPELIAASMRSALDELTGLAGDVTPDEVLGRIFADFCVGK